jgi:site-specific DNA-methyltransferase (adenine-specific)
VRLILGDSREELRGLEPESVDALCTDPPAGIGFMGKDWDGAKGGRDAWASWLAGVAGYALRVMKPGAHGLVWALPRTSHWTATALEDAGFEIRDVIMHVFGSGFPKSLDVSKAIDSAAGAEREVVGSRRQRANNKQTSSAAMNASTGEYEDITTPATPDAQRWHGWGTALKPAAEHWILVRKPLSGTVAATVLEHGTGGINVEGCRVGTGENLDGGAYSPSPDGLHQNQVYGQRSKLPGEYEQPAGRWPPHVFLSHSQACTDRCEPGCPVRIMDEQSGESSTPASVPNPDFRRGSFLGGTGRSGSRCTLAADSGGASRFFPRFRYQPKPSRAEREAGCEHLPGKSAAEVTERDEGAAGQKHARSGKTMTGEIHNHHPTLKSLDLMRWLVRLITPPGGVVLDPFMGSGTTGCACACEGFDFVGIEQDPEYIQIARARIEHYSASRHEVENDDSERPVAVGQRSLW